MTSNRKVQSSAKTILMRRSKPIMMPLISTWPKPKWKQWRKRSVRPSLSLFKRRRERRLERSSKDNSSRSSRDLRLDIKSFLKSSKSLRHKLRLEKSSSSNKKLRQENSFKESYRKRKKCFSRP